MIPPDQSLSDVSSDILQLKWGPNLEYSLVSFMPMSSWSANPFRMQAQSSGEGLSTEGRLTSCILLIDIGENLGIK